MNIKSFLFAAASTLGVLTLAHPASAITYSFEVGNDDGTFGDGSEVASFFIEFDPATVVPNATNVAATNVQVTGITNLSTPNPFFGDGGLELNQNLVPLAAFNSFSFGATTDNIFGFNFLASSVDTGGNTEEFDTLGNGSFVFQFLSEGDGFSTDGRNGIVDVDFTPATAIVPSTAVPFEFSPGMGLVLAGGFMAGSRLLKQRQNSNFNK